MNKVRFNNLDNVGRWRAYMYNQIFFLETGRWAYITRWTYEVGVL